MTTNTLNHFRELLIKNKQSVSEIEYTKNNYDNNGKLIKKGLPTITTNFCEIGLYHDEVYFVFIIDSKTFNLKLFNEIKDKSNVKIYGFVDFNKTLYPANNFNLATFIKQIKKDKHLQIQFNDKDVDASDLFKKYSDLVNIFEKSKVEVINQLKINPNYA